MCVGGLTLHDSTLAIGWPHFARFPVPPLPYSLDSNSSDCLSVQWCRRTDISVAKYHFYMIVEVFDGAVTFVTDGVGHVEMGPCCSGVSLCC